jgi:hypothetical protein
MSKGNLISRLEAAERQLPGARGPGMVFMTPAEYQKAEADGSLAKMSGCLLFVCPADPVATRGA